MMQFRIVGLLPLLQLIAPPQFELPSRIVKFSRTASAPSPAAKMNARSEPPQSIIVSSAMLSPETVMAFLRDRLYQLLVDEGRRFDLVRAALAAGMDDIRDVDRRVQALTAMCAAPWWETLVALVERIANILKGSEIPESVDAVLPTANITQRCPLQDSHITPPRAGINS